MCFDPSLTGALRILLALECDGINPLQFGWPPAYPNWMWFDYTEYAMCVIMPVM